MEEPSDKIHLLKNTTTKAKIRIFKFTYNNWNPRYVREGTNKNIGGMHDDPCIQGIKNNCTLWNCSSIQEIINIKKIQTLYMLRII